MMEKYKFKIIVLSVEKMKKKNLLRSKKVKENSFSG